MNEKELVHSANQIGVSAGQIALGEYILQHYKGQMSTKLENFLNKVISSEYSKVSEIVEKPAEDVALEVAKLFHK